MLCSSTCEEGLAAPAMKERQGLLSTEFIEERRWEAEGAAAPPVLVRPRGGSPRAPERCWQQLYACLGEQKGWESGELDPATPALHTFSAGKPRRKRNAAEPQWVAGAQPALQPQLSLLPRNPSSMSRADS